MQTPYLNLNQMMFPQQTATNLFNSIPMPNHMNQVGALMNSRLPASDESQ